MFRRPVGLRAHDDAGFGGATWRLKRMYLRHAIQDIDQTTGIPRARVRGGDDHVLRLQNRDARWRPRARAVNPSRS